jgi:hypothetical protein
VCESERKRENHKWHLLRIKFGRKIEFMWAIIKCHLLGRLSDKILSLMFPQEEKLFYGFEKEKKRKDPFAVVNKSRLQNFPGIREMKI